MRISTAVIVIQKRQMLSFVGRLMINNRTGCSLGIFVFNVHPSKAEKSEVWRQYRFRKLKIACFCLSFLLRKIKSHSTLHYSHVILIWIIENLVQSNRYQQNKTLLNNNMMMMLKKNKLKFWDIFKLMQRDSMLLFSMTTTTSCIKWISTISNSLFFSSIIQLLLKPHHNTTTQPRTISMLPWSSLLVQKH
jgi:hypothetical protein